MNLGGEKSGGGHTCSGEGEVGERVFNLGFECYGNGKKRGGAATSDSQGKTKEERN